MNKILVYALLSTIFTSCATNARVDEGRLTDFDIYVDIHSQTFTLANGLTVVLSKNESAPKTSIIHWVKAGSIHEQDSITGVAHMLEHLMYRPDTVDKASFDMLLKPLGGTENGNTRYTSTVFQTEVDNDKVQEALQLEASRFQSLIVSSESLDIEREAVRSEHTRDSYSKPNEDRWLALYEKGFPNHPYGRTVIGRRGDLDKIKVADCLDFKSSFYRPNNTGLFISGNFNVNEIKRSVEELYGPWKRRSIESSIPRFRGENTIIAQGNLSSNSRALLLGYRLDEVDPVNFQKFLLADFILVESVRSLMKQKLVFETRIASSIDKGNTEYDSALSQFNVYLQDGKNPQQVLAAIAKIPDLFEVITEETYQSYLREFQVAQAEKYRSNIDINMSLATYWGKYSALDKFSETIHHLPKVSKSEMLIYLQKLLNPKNAIAITSKWDHR